MKARGGSGRFDGGEWPKLVVGALAVEKRKRTPFERAWAIAVQLYPPSRHGYGVRAVARQDASETAYAFFKRVAHAYYEDRIPTRADVDEQAA